MPLSRYSLMPSIDWKLLTIPSKRLTTKIRHSLVTPIDWKLINPLVGIIYTVLRNNQKTRSPSAKPPYFGTAQMLV